MRIAVIGGGPAGLYLAILVKARMPAAEITVYERNRPDDTFGFGVVFSDATLDTFERYDPKSYRRITDEFSYWDDIEVHVKGTVHRIGGNGFCGCARRTLLAILQERARELGVSLEFGVEIEDETAFADHDLVVVADGINSRLRERYAEHFEPEVDLRPNRFTWMGSTRPLDAFTFLFEETEWGPFIAHAYQYEPGRSTWIFETDPDTFARAGLDRDGRGQQSAALMERIFARLPRRGTPRRHQPIAVALLPHDPHPSGGCTATLVLIGDAKATAHFSIGSGTKLAMEDAIALHAAIARHPDVPSALVRATRAGRREEVEKIQHAADVSLVWFEHVGPVPGRFRSDPVRLRRHDAFAKAITYDNLRLQGAGLRRRGRPELRGESVAQDGARRRCRDRPVVPDVPAPEAARPDGSRIGSVLSPMCLYSAAKDGDPERLPPRPLRRARHRRGGPPVHGDDVRRRATPASRRAARACGATSRRPPGRRIVDFVHANSAAKICLQLGHAGRKGATKLMWDGMDRPLAEGGWDVLSASPDPLLPGRPGAARDETGPTWTRVRDAFVASTESAAERASGSTCSRLHCSARLPPRLLPVAADQPAHRPRMAAALENRMRFPLEVFAAMRADLARDGKPMSVRLSATDWAEGGLTPA